MSGKFSRSKGRRGEQQLVLYLKQKGGHAERILRQYQFSGQPDVKWIKNGVTYTFENKARRNSFKTIYDLYYSERDERGLLAFTLSSSGPFVAMSSDITTLLGESPHFLNLTLFPPDKKLLKVYNRIAGLSVLKQTADFLSIKDNNKRLLFLRYWG